MKKKQKGVVVFSSDEYNYSRVYDSIFRRNNSRDEFLALVKEKRGYDALNRENLILNFSKRMICKKVNRNKKRDTLIIEFAEGIKQKTHNAIYYDIYPCVNNLDE